MGERPTADAHTTLAAGGINAALTTMNPEGSWQHAADTIKKSYFLAGPNTVRTGADVRADADARSAGDERF